MLDRYVKDRWREERLTVNYRTPAEIMAVAADVLAAIAPDQQPPESVREEGAHPRAIRVGAAAGGPSGQGLDRPGLDRPGLDRPGSTARGWTARGWTARGWTDQGWTDRGWTDRGWTDRGWTDQGWTDQGWTDRRLDGTVGFGATVTLVVAEELAGLTAAEEGRLAVIAPAARQAELAAAIPGAVAGDRAEALDAPVALLTVAQAKGLEFDRVVLADPAGIIAQSPQGGHDLYVAISRATHRLAVVHEGDLPPMLAALAAAPAPVS